MDKNAYIRRFIAIARRRFGQIPSFIHTTANAVNYSGPSYDDDELSAILESVMFGKWLSAGEKVQEFEKNFSEMFGFNASVMVNSGSSANLVMIGALKKYYGWDDGDAIILSVVGFPTTLSAVVLNNLTPVFADIEFDSLNFNIHQIPDLIGTRTRGIFISPVLGNPPDMDFLSGLAEDSGIKLILDNCDSLGSMWKGRYLSDYCVASSHSFYPAHHLVTGEGGMVSSLDRKIVSIARKMVSWGRDCHCVGTDNLLPDGTCGNRFGRWLPDQDVVLDHKYVFTETGYNLKPLDLQGAIGIEQLKKFTTFYHRRGEGYNIIKLFLGEFCPDVKVIAPTKHAVVSWFGVPVVCPSKDYKVKLVAHLEANRIQTRNYFAGNILLHEAYSHLGYWGDYPEANKVLERVFFLGCSPNYTKDTFDYIKDVLSKFRP